MPRAVPLLLGADGPSLAKTPGLDLPPRWGLAADFTLPDLAGPAPAW
jgi:hypothetical protein